MKVKIKLSIEQFKYLLKYIDACVYKKILFFNEIDLINLRAFLSTGYKRLIDLQSAAIFTPDKVKTFNIEINQFNIVMNVLTKQREFLDAFNLATFETLRAQNKSLFTIGFNS